MFLVKCQMFTRSEARQPAGEGGSDVKCNKRGFTLLEILVTIGIFVLLTVILLANYPEFRSHVSVGRIAREIALTIRESQAFGLAVRESGSKIPEDHGIYLDIENEPKEIILFKEDEGSYDEYELYNYATLDCKDGNNPECLAVFKINTAVHIEDICVLTSGGKKCYVGSSDGEPKVLNIVTRRIKPDAIIHDDSAGAGHTYNAACIKLQADQYPDRFKFVRVWITGQISIHDNCGF